MRPSRIVRGASVSESLRIQAKKLRREMTPAERVLWSHLRVDRLSGYHFRRQQVIASCIVDFYCHRLGVIIELDGDIHRFQRIADAEREAMLVAAGFRLLRFANEEVFTDIDGVLERIMRVCREVENAPEEAE